MIRGTAIALACLLGSMATAAETGWTVHKRPDPLDPKASEAYATTDAAERPVQFGKPLRAWLMARCVEQWADGPWIAVSFNFPAPVSLSDVKARWRVDSMPVQEAFLVPKAQGRVFEIYEATGPHAVIQQLKTGAKSLKAEMILPWAGPSVLTYNVAGSKQAFAQVRCKN